MMERLIIESMKWASKLHNYILPVIAILLGFYWVTAASTKAVEEPLDYVSLPFKR